MAAEGEKKKGMVKVFCHKKGDLAWANRSGKGGKEYILRCTHCGETHTA